MLPPRPKSIGQAWRIIIHLREELLRAESIREHQLILVKKMVDSANKNLQEDLKNFEAQAAIPLKKSRRHAGTAEKDEQRK